MRTIENCRQTRRELRRAGCRIHGVHTERISSAEYGEWIFVNDMDAVHRDEFGAEKRGFRCLLAIQEPPVIADAYSRVLSAVKVGVK